VLQAGPGDTCAFVREKAMRTHARFLQSEPTCRLIAVHLVVARERGSGDELCSSPYRRGTTVILRRPPGSDAPVRVRAHRTRGYRFVRENARDLGEPDAGRQCREKLRAGTTGGCCMFFARSIAVTAPQRAKNTDERREYGSADRLGQPAAALQGGGYGHSFSREGRLRLSRTGLHAG
jgi:hypothetical protein